MSKEQQVPIILEHCQSVYEQMSAQAKPDEAGNLIWEGFLTKVFKDLRLAVPYYTNVMKELKAMDCVRQVRRGGSTTPSRWVLLRAPTAELRDEAKKRPAVNTDSTGQALRDHNQRIALLETQVKELQQFILKGAE